MDNTMCRRFDTLRSYLPDELGKAALDLKTLKSFNNYCPIAGSENKCETELDKINGGCLWLFDQLFVKNKKNDINIAEYIIIWLSYKLNQKTYEGINNLNDFYVKYIQNNTYYNKCDNGGQDCSDTLTEITGYTNYKEIIDKKKELLSINFGLMSKFYDAFKPLCNMYTELDANDTSNKNYLDCAKEFVGKYNELNEVSDITEDSPYYQVLSTLSNDYNNFKGFCNRISVDCNDIPSLSPIKIKENGVQGSVHNDVQNFGVTSSSSSITNKLIPVVSIFVAISFFLGISYKVNNKELKNILFKYYFNYIYVN
ncbi:hypothetical protein YYC_04779, partial [Plasmodium yoelii 17X]